MTIYQKAIKVKKICKSRELCKGCPYFDKCNNSEIVINEPMFTNIQLISKAIKKEKWKVK